MAFLEEVSESIVLLYGLLISAARETRQVCVEGHIDSKDLVPF